ncbi:MAG: Na/Pi symporter [Candidatus Gastranaerophilales bacterium]|nr:Na/Pi symporter [Candidatus Gastranaerophilales bacterium]
MGFFVILEIAGGLALFLSGMDWMGEGLSSLIGGRIERLFHRLTDHSLKALAVGTAVTAVVQSSSAVTVMAVGLVDSGLMRLEQAVGVIMGANVGTTVTSWLLALAGIESDSFWPRLFQPMSLAMTAALAGMAAKVFLRGAKQKSLIKIGMGFAVLMIGMDTMKNGAAPLMEMPAFAGALVRFADPVSGLLAGTALTALIQSSSASVGLLQVLCLNGAFCYETVIPVILGQNIGTCATALLSCAGASIHAKRAALVHLYFNVIGAALFLVLFWGAKALGNFPVLQETATPMGIAAVHSLFNLSSTVCLAPFSRQLALLACMTLKERGERPPLRRRSQPLSPSREHL